MKFDVQMNLVQEYSSSDEVKINNVSVREINKWAQKKLFRNDYFWGYSENYPELSRFAFAKKNLSF